MQCPSDPGTGISRAHSSGTFFHWGRPRTASAACALTLVASADSSPNTESTSPSSSSARSTSRSASSKGAIAFAILAYEFVRGRPGNLPRALETEKLERLTEQIAESFGTRPLTYLAGRYGFGANTAAILEELGYEVDISPAVPINFSDDGGPDYSGYSSHPYWFGSERTLNAANPKTGLAVNGVFDTTTGKVFARIPVGAEDHGLTYFPNVGAHSLGHNGVYR